MIRIISVFFLLTFLLPSCKPIYSGINITSTIIFPNTHFDHVKVYQFNLPDEATWNEYAERRSNLTQKLSKSQRDKTIKLSKSELEELKHVSILVEGERILDADKNLAKSAKLEKRLSTLEIKELTEILLVKNNGIPLLEAECYYPRDAILFYQKSKVIGVIEICFACRVVKFQPALDIELGEKNYNALLQFVRNL